MKHRKVFRAVMVVGIVLSGFVGVGLWAQQDKYTLQVPNGLKFSDFRGYENWQVVAVSQTDSLLKVMVANPTMIDAYRAGIPGNGKPFPDGSKIAKIEWKPKKSTESPFAVRIPESLQDVFFIEKDAKRFPNTKGWAYAVFDYNPASDTFTPDPTGRRQLAGSSAIRSWRKRTTFSQSTGSDDRAERTELKKTRARKGVPCFLEAREDRQKSQAEGTRGGANPAPSPASGAKGRRNDEQA